MNRFVELITEAAGINCSGYPIPPELPDEPARPFPLECLPGAAGDMARAISRAERTPEKLAGCCVLGIMSASIGAGLQVQSGPDRRTRGNLYLLPSAESGSGKSETFRHAARPLHVFEAELFESWRTGTLPKLQAEAAVLEAEIAKLKRDAGKERGAIEREEVRAELELKMAEQAKVGEALRPPALLCEDVTSERLAVLLANSNEQVASLSPDAGAIVNNLLGRYSKLDRTDEGIYLKAYSGDYCRVDRQGREPVVLRHPCLSALWLVQPDKIETLLAEQSLTDGGLVPRLLVCHTRAQPRPIVDGAQGIPASTANAWALLVGTLLQRFRLASEPSIIHPSPEALAAMNAHYNAIVARRLTDLTDVSSYAARWNEQAWRIGVCLHAGLHGDAADKHRLELGTAQDAVTLAEWFTQEQLAILAGGREQAKRNLEQLVLALAADQPRGVTARDIQRGRITNTAEEARALLQRMEAEGILGGRDEQPEGGGKPSRIYTKAKR